MNTTRAVIIIAKVAGFALLLALVPTRGVTTTFPLQVKMSYTKASGAVSVQGSTLPGTVVQVRNASTVVKSTGTYALKTSLPLSLAAVRQGTIRRFRFDLPDKARPYITMLTISADLTHMWSSVTGSLSLTEHPPATIVVTHVERGTTHKATLTKGHFVIGLPLAKGLNTLHWHLQVGVVRWPGPDITFTVQ